MDSLLLGGISEKIAFFKKRGSLDSAIHHSHILLSEAKLVNNTFFEINAHNKLAVYYKKINAPFKAVQHYTKSKELNLKIGDTAKAIEKIRHIASVQKTLGDFNSSENSAIEGLKLIAVLPDSLKLKHSLGILNHLGITTKELKNYSDSKNWYLQALEFAKDSVDIIKIQNNIGVVNLKLGKYKETLESLTKYTRSPIISKSPALKAKVLDNIAFSKSKLNYPNAEKELKLVLDYRKNSNDISGQFASNIHLAEHFLIRKNNKKALIYTNQAYEIAKTIHSSTSKVKALSYLIKLKNNPKIEAVELQRLTDSINTSRIQAKNQFAKIQYETDRYREENFRVKDEIAQQKIVLQQQKNHKVIFISVVLTLCLLTGFIFYYLKQKSKIELIKERHYTEKKLSKKLHDEIGNDLYHMLLQLQNSPNFSSKQNNIRFFSGFNNIYQRVKDFSRDLKIETGEEYHYELISLLNSYSNQQCKVAIIGSDPNLWAKVATFKKEELFLIIKELLTNMKKHSKATFTAISFKKKRRKITVTYFDNGIGVDFNQYISKNGLNNVKNRIDDIKGSVNFESEPNQGFKITIVFTI